MRICIIVNAMDDKARKFVQAYGFRFKAQCAVLFTQSLTCLAVFYRRTSRSNDAIMEIWIVVVSVGSMNNVGFGAFVACWIFRFNVIIVCLIESTI